jgi:hypothetical protein
MNEYFFKIEPQPPASPDEITQEIRNKFMANVLVSKKVKKTAGRIKRKGWNQTRDFRGEEKKEYENLLPLEKIYVLANIGSGHLNLMTKHIDIDDLINIIIKTDSQVCYEKNIYKAIQEAYPNEYSQILEKANILRKRTDGTPSHELHLANIIIPKALQKSLNTEAVGFNFYKAVRKEVFNTWPLEKSEKDFIHEVRNKKINKALDLPKEVRQQFNKLQKWQKLRLRFLAFPNDYKALAFLYPHMELRHWIQYAKGCSGFKNFKNCGGPWLKSNREDILKNIKSNSHEIWFGLCLANDGTLVGSFAELYFFNVLHENKRILAWEAHPSLDEIKYKSLSYCMKADANIKLIDSPNWHNTVEIFGRFLGQNEVKENDKRTKGVLERRVFKVANAEKYPFPLIIFEAQILSKYGIQAYCEHIVSGIEYCLKVKLTMPCLEILTKGNRLRPDIMSPKDVAIFMVQKGTQRLSDLPKNGYQFIYKAICQRNINAEVERNLSRLLGRPCNVRVVGAAEKSIVEEYIRTNHLDHGQYILLHEENELLYNFPKHPKQTYENWSWTKARGEFSRKEFIKSYQDAKGSLKKYQNGELDGIIRNIKNGKEYENHVKSSKLLKGKLPIQPDNRESGGLDLWHGWQEFLDNPEAEKYYKNLSNLKQT